MTAKITGTLSDEDLLLIYTINKVLLPKKMFRTEASTAPTPALHRQRRQTPTRSSGVGWRCT